MNFNCDVSTMVWPTFSTWPWPNVGGPVHGHDQQAILGKSSIFAILLKRPDHDGPGWAELGRAKGQVSHIRHVSPDLKNVRKIGWPLCRSSSQSIIIKSSQMSNFRK